MAERTRPGPGPVTSSSRACDELSTGDACPGRDDLVTLPCACQTPAVRLGAAALHGADTGGARRGSPLRDGWVARVGGRRTACRIQPPKARISNARAAT